MPLMIMDRYLKYVCDLWAAEHPHTWNVQTLTFSSRCLHDGLMNTGLGNDQS